MFTQTKREADELVSGGVFKSLTAQALHGDLAGVLQDRITENDVRRTCLTDVTDVHRTFDGCPLDVRQAFIGSTYVR